MADRWLRKSPASPALPLCAVLCMAACWLRKFPPSPPALYVIWKTTSTTRRPQKSFSSTRSVLLPSQLSLPPPMHLECLTGAVARRQAASMFEKYNILSKKPANAHNIEQHTRQRKISTRASLHNSCISVGLTATGEPSLPASSMPTNAQKDNSTKH